MSPSLEEEPHIPKRNIVKTGPLQKRVSQWPVSIQRAIHAIGHKGNTKENKRQLYIHRNGHKSEGPTALSVSVDGEELDRVTCCWGPGGVWARSPGVESWRYLPEPDLCLLLTNSSTPGSPRKMNACARQMILLVMALLARAQTCSREPAERRAGR